jgi:hypothetical protein
MKEVKAQETPKAKLQFEPSNVTVGVLGQDLPTPVTTINVTVANVTDLYAWQAKVYFDQLILSFEGGNAAVRPPSDIDIFRGFTSTEYWFLSFIGTDSGTTRRYLQVGGMLLADPETFITPSVNGSGVLAQIKFKGVSSGASHLNFSRPDPVTSAVDTYLWNTTSDTTNIPIPADLVDATVTVLGNGISLSIEPEMLEIGGTTNITGLIFPRQETSVIISYMLNGTDTEWKPLATVQTRRIDINATYYVTRFDHTWKPDREGLYYVKADGGGYVSQEKTLMVNPPSGPPPPNLWLLYGPPVAFAGIVVGGFFLWDRRRRHSSRMILP